MNQFDEETKLEQRDKNRFIGRMSSAWNIANNPNGGYLMALATNALRQLTPRHQDPLSITAHYLRPGAGGQDCEVHGEVLREGASISTTRGTLSQDGKSRLEVLAAFGDLAVGVHNVSPSMTMALPDMPSPEKCIVRSGEAQGVGLPIMQRLDILLHPDDTKLGGSGRPEIRGWVRFKDGRTPDALAALLFADALPPAIFGLLGVVGWVPTIELTVQVRRRPAPGWVFAQFRMHDLHDGRMIEDGALWDSNGQLFAQSRQLAMLLPKA